MIDRSSRTDPNLRWLDQGKLLVALVAASMAVVLGMLASVQPVLGIGAIALIGSALLLALGERLASLYLGALVIVLAGYAILGRGFAYLGAPPVFVGEILLGVAILTLLVMFRHWKLTLPIGLMFIFMALGALSTVPHISTHGIDALRDAVLWGYATFALVIAWSIREHHFKSLVSWYGRLIPVFLVLTPLILLASSAIDGIPTVPGSDVPIITAKAGDLGVHLGGIAAFVIVGLWSRQSAARSRLEFLLWPIWFVGILLAGSLNRGGLIAAAVCVTVAIMIRPSRRIAKPTFIAAILITLVLLINPTVDLGTGRQVSVDQVTSNLKSIVDNSESQHLSSTREWRLQWWADIVDYTVRGQYFWTGKGFGINLAESDGYSGDAFPLMRSPHNSHMTVLARMGVPGFIFWIALQATFGLMLLSTIRRASRRQNTRWAQLTVWIFVYWIAMMVNSSFDVYLEGPQAGIWFWTLFGLGLAACRLERHVVVPTSPQTDNVVEPDTKRQFPIKSPHPQRS